MLRCHSSFLRHSFFLLHRPVAVDSQSSVSSHHPFIHTRIASHKHCIAATSEIGVSSTRLYSNVQYFNRTQFIATYFNQSTSIANNVDKCKLLRPTCALNCLRALQLHGETRAGRDRSRASRPHDQNIYVSHGMISMRRCVSAVL